MSRQRIVTVREEERRRLRRDLHDGLDPTLATLTLQAEAARDLITSDPDKSRTLLDEIIFGLQTALADIRRVVYALRPPALDDLGLISAINVQAAQYSTDLLMVRVEVPEHIPPLPQRSSRGLSHRVRGADQRGAPRSCKILHPASRCQRDGAV